MIDITHQKMKNRADKNFYQTYKADRCEPLIAAANSGQLEMSALGRANYPGLELPEGVLGGVYNIGYWNAKTGQNWGLDWHRNEGIEFTYLASGNLDFSVEQKCFRLNSGDLTVTRPWQLHRVGKP